MPECKFCGRSDKPLVNAHVIPRSFFRIVRADAKYSVAVKARGNALVPHFTQAGFADRTSFASHARSDSLLGTPMDSRFFRGSANPRTTFTPTVCCGARGFIRLMSHCSKSSRCQCCGARRYHRTPFSRKSNWDPTPTQFAIT